MMVSIFLAEVSKFNLDIARLRILVFILYLSVACYLLQEYFLDLREDDVVTDLG